jgi:FkbM family methyltransferase
LEPNVLRHHLLGAAIQVGGWLRKLGLRTASRGVARITRSLVPPPASPVTVRTITGAKLEVDPRRNRGVDRAVYYTGAYEAGTVGFVRDLMAGAGVFYDIGANIGVFTVEIARSLGPSGQVVAFEPAPHAFAVLLRNIKLNRLGNVTPIAVGLADVAGPGQLYLRPAMNLGAASFVAQPGAVPDAVVGLWRLDDLVTQRGLPDPTVVKVDVEGFELRVLRGAVELIERARPVIVTEWSTRHTQDGGGLEGLQRLLAGAGYRPFGFRHGKEHGGTLRSLSDLSGLLHDNVVWLPAR